MNTFVLTLHIILSCLLVFIILMQPGKGADPSSAFGGGASSQLFGASGPGNLLTRGTGFIATLFMVTSITLAYQSTKSNMEGGGVEGGFEDVLDDGKKGGGFGGTPADAPEPDGSLAPDAPPPSDAPSPDAAPADAVPALPQLPPAGPTFEGPPAPSPELIPPAPVPAAP